jgi:AraC family transcriptional regulator, regulatory protein of adaptative response / methylated-DNA-[protein]-cysteine methyltransferase
LNHAKRLLDGGAPLLDASYELGLSGPGRLHDLFIHHEALSPGEYKAKGAGLIIRYGFHESPFGRALIMVTNRGMCGLGFSDGDDAFALQDMVRRWPLATYLTDETVTYPYAARVFDPARWQSDQPLKIVMIGTDFQVRVWQALLDVPMGEACRYGDLAKVVGSPKGSRAVGAAVGANPLSFVVPCHRAVGSTGALTGYHWGLTRKRAILGWEVGQTLRSKAV